MKLKLALPIAAAIALAGCAAQPVAPAAAPVASAEVEAPKQVYVIRHLQKATGDDPSLTAEGAANAARLAELLGDKGITAIFATPTKRAMETAEPLARKLNLVVQPYQPRDFASLAAAVAKAPGPVLIVGHSNTVPDIVAHFGAPRPVSLTEADYGTLFVVDPAGTVATVEVR